jgi:hypothetical protein
VSYFISKVRPYPLVNNLLIQAKHLSSHFKMLFLFSVQVILSPFARIQTCEWKSYLLDMQSGNKNIEKLQI